MPPHDPHGLPPSSSALIALSSLSPPSPILSPSGLSTAVTWTSMEIPIFLDFDSEEHTHDNSRSSYRDSSSSLALGILPSSSISTIGTVGTFGPTRKKKEFRESMAYSETPVALERFPYSHLGSNSTSIPTADMVDEALVFEGDPQAPTPISYFKKDTRSIYQSVIGLENDPPTFSEALSLELYDDSESPQMSDDRPQTPSDTSPLLSASESFLNYARRRSRTSYGSNCQADAHTRKLAIAAALASLESRCDSAPSSPQGSRTNCPPRPIRVSKDNLPKNLAWLENTTVEMLIDQEGFRGVLARFKFTGYSGQRSPGMQSVYGEGGVAQFRPIHRQKFNFHYAPLEGLPVLRRITVNGEETRDYISRQASLGLKSNGVYVVHGHETPCLHTSRADVEHSQPSLVAETLKLHWRFEYLVDDRRVELSGKKVVDGEKILTPLSFACSPLVLHPLQGKRIRLMHVMKKSVAPNLTSEKMEPPAFLPNTRSLSLSPSGGQRSTIRKTHLQPTLAHLDSKPPHVFPWNMHRRAKSHFTQQTDDHDVPYTPSTVTVLPAAVLEMKVPEQSKVIRRRRASSAGERSRPGITPPNSGSRVEIPPRVSPLYHPARHIIPRSRLAALVDDDVEDPAPSHPVVEVSMLQAESLSFLPLSPSPRHHQTQCRPTAIES
ncbi:hypothetical protein Hypma_015833 [Hypsizygus marmoreus]|uniref:Uncharacterized protein n=1 Tax=Hypsizygus marmoreus TaxID=39966 RepID=A0A369KFD5_HYPMA|nr:hypothetical protein Hypma_015833 [Hypsizygus marmoreus]